eukprot:TRINITY_DN19207_c0_g1_i1.p1 TRINITY_DN19207_c0_g1~~TRINITY_DN19207_c0_g1_i1.p1  ORF type:complete len:410 (+),score=75.03 TRINITY_DN19207_c0_g1_i1:38-1231(+)
MAAADNASKYAGLAPDTRGHSSWFLTRTNKEHQATMEHPFMKTIYAKTFDSKAYVHHLASQFLMFQELERLVDVRRAEAPLDAVYDASLLREAPLAADLAFWCGPAWRSRVATPSSQTARYLEMLRADADDPWMLLCHHFLQYNAVLSGGQYLGGMVSARANEGRAVGSADGATFYEFPADCQPTHARVQRYIDSVDGLAISSEARERMLARMRTIYGCLLAMFDEAYALAPVEGMSYNESKAQGGSSAKPKVPPPMAPTDRPITMQELSKHDGHVNPAAPILTSVLGRIYDVSKAKDLFGPGGPYEMFAGHDGTYNLAVMSLKKQSLDRFSYELDADDRECLADWIAYFDNRYGRPVGVLAEVKHAVQLRDLPAATKIPFSDSSESTDAQPPASRL